MDADSLEGMSTSWIFGAAEKRDLKKKKNLTKLQENRKSKGSLKKKQPDLEIIHLAQK